MGDDENGATLHEAFQRLQNGRFRFDVYCAGWFVGVSRQGHINQSVKVRPRRIDSSLVAGEAPWSESNTVMPSDNMLRKEHAQITRLQRAVNADVASLHVFRWLRRSITRESSKNEPK